MCTIYNLVLHSDRWTLYSRLTTSRGCGDHIWCAGCYGVYGWPGASQIWLPNQATDAILQSSARQTVSIQFVSLYVIRKQIVRNRFGRQWTKFMEKFSGVDYTLVKYISVLLWTNPELLLVHRDARRPVNQDDKPYTCMSFFSKWLFCETESLNLFWSRRHFFSALSQAWILVSSDHTHVHLFAFEVRLDFAYATSQEHVVPVSAVEATGGHHFTVLFQKSLFPESFKTHD